MTPDRDVVLVETVRTHHARLVAAFLYGELDQRRPVTDNLRRLAVGLVVTALGCFGCVAYAVITSYLTAQHGRGR